ncbi:MAG: GNVR domain-containing protein, partial [Flavobacteriales bacterium]
NLEMNEKAVLELEAYISGGDYFNERSINFGFGDLLMTELVKKLKLWQDERIDLLVKYTPESQEVIAVDQKIEELKNYIVEAIKRNKSEIMTKKEEIEKSLNVVSNQFDGLSTREKELRILERNFHIQEQVFNFLSQKKIEASIAASANISFHRIIQRATVPSKPVAPNRTLITFVAGLLGLMLGITFIYLRKYARAKVSGRQDIERHSALPLLGLIRSGNSEEDFLGLSKVLKLKKLLEEHTVIAVSSTINGEGKSYVSAHLAGSLSKTGRKIALLKMNEESTNSEDLDVFLSSETKAKSSLTQLHTAGKNQLDLNEKLEQLKQHFDLVVVDTPAAGISVDGIEVMNYADVNLYIIRANKTSIDYLSHADRLVEEYQIRNVMLVLNDAHKASNHSGSFVGTRFREKLKPTSLNLKLRTYLKTYLK